MVQEKTLAWTLLHSFICWHFRSRRLEDRIRELCAKAVATTEPAELNTILEHLSAALHEQIGRLRKQMIQGRMRPERRLSRS
jgi:hypothetical protein